MPDLPSVHGSKKQGTVHVRQRTDETGKAVPRSSTAQGYGYRWQKYREQFLKKNPLCVHCLREKCVEQATEVDHIEPHRGDQKKFWDRKNHQGLCKPHHSQKTAAENGGFGNKEKNC